MVIELNSYSLATVSEEEEPEAWYHVELGKGVDRLV